MWICNCGRQNADTGNFCVSCGAAKNDVLAAPLDDNTLWYYYKDGERLGPVAAKEIEALLRTGQMDRKMLVWKSGMPDWLPLHQTPLYTLALTVLPPVPLKAASDKYAWTIAFIPLCQFCLSLAGASTSAGVIVTAVLTLLFWVLDMQEMDKTNNKVGLWPVLGLIFMPAYLFVRGRKVGRKYDYAIVYCIVLVVLPIIETIIKTF